MTETALCFVVAVARKFLDRAHALAYRSLQVCKARHVQGPSAQQGLLFRPHRSRYRTPGLESGVSDEAPLSLEEKIGPLRGGGVES